MKVFLLDIVHDLRTKRLWPVALALLIGIVAVPLVLLVALAPKAAPAVAGPAAAPAEVEVLRTQVKVTSEPEGGSSDLDSFESHNPFRPKGGPVKEKDPQGEPSSPPAQDASQESTTPSDGSSSEATPPGKSPAGGEDGSSSESNDDSSAQGTPAKSDDKSSSGNDSTEETVKVDEEVRVLSYNAETAYGPAGHVKKHTVLPNDVFPSSKRYFLYSGVSKDGKDAIFTVLDPTLVSERKGDGHCVQVSGRCAVLHLRDGDERRFEDEKGNAFVIRLGALDPVKKLVEDLSGKVRDTVDDLLGGFKN